MQVRSSIIISVLFLFLLPAGLLAQGSISLRTGLSYSSIIADNAGYKTGRNFGFSLDDTNNRIISSVEVNFRQRGANVSSFVKRKYYSSNPQAFTKQDDYDFNALYLEFAVMLKYRLLKLGNMQFHPMTGYSVSLGLTTTANPNRGIVPHLPRNRNSGTQSLFKLNEQLPSFVAPVKIVYPGGMQNLHFGFQLTFKRHKIDFRYSLSTNGVKFERNGDTDKYKHHSFAVTFGFILFKEAKQASGS